MTHKRHPDVAARFVLRLRRGEHSPIERGQRQPTDDSNLGTNEGGGSTGRHPESRNSSETGTSSGWMMHRKL